MPVYHCLKGKKGIVFRKADDWTPKKALRGIIKDILRDSHYLRNCKNLREQKCWGKDDSVGGPVAWHASLVFRDRGSIILEVCDEMLLINHPPKKTTRSYFETGSTREEVACSLLRSLLINRPVREKSLVVVLGASMQVDVIYRFSGS